MLDYKFTSDYKFKKLDKDFNKCFKSIRRLDNNKKPHKLAALLKGIFTIFKFPGIKNFSISNRMPDFIRKPSLKKNILLPSLIAVLIITVLLIIFLSFKPQQKIDNYGISYIGKVKIQEEFDSMANPEGSGGNEIKSFDTNSSELKFFFYKIKQGESLYTISKKLGMSMDTLISLNSLENAHNLGEGKRIIVPNLQGILYSVKKNDSVEEISKKYKIAKADILDANDLEDESIAEGQILFLPGAQLTEMERAKALGYLFMKPLFGRLTSGFGIRRDPFTGGTGYHPGIDISAPIGTLVKASKEGRVIFTGWNGGYGKCIIIQHQFGFESVYGHLSSIGIQKDTWVKAGQYIGRVGSTGYSTGSHLHFEIRKFGRPTNPLRLGGLMKGRGMWY